MTHATLTSTLTIGLATWLMLHGLAQAPAAPQERITIRAARVFDGERLLRGQVVEIDAGRIVSVGPRTGPVTHDLGDVTVLPGLIDVHTHIDWHFGPDGRYGNRPGAPARRPNSATPPSRPT